MKAKLILAVLLLPLPAALQAAGATQQPAVRPNVLFIAVDDLRTSLGCYGDPLAKSPNIDALARSSRLFHGAYTHQAVCGPARTAILTGRLPDNTRVWHNRNLFRDTLPDAVTLPQLFKNHGYRALSFGKIFSGDQRELDPLSWSAPEVLRGEGPGWKNYALARDSGGKGVAYKAADVPDDGYPDDNGRSWQHGEITLRNAGEPNITELPDGRVLVTARNSDPRNRRVATCSADGATGWAPPEFIADLLEPGCMAGLVGHPGTRQGSEPFLLFSNPHTTERAHKKRVDVAIKLSKDGGRTWPVSRVLQSGPSAYSDLAVLPDGTMLCFYESGDPSFPRKYGRPWAYSFLTAAHFNLEWLLSGHDSAQPLRAADVKP